jgi:hypothetical protein
MTKLQTIIAEIKTLPLEEQRAVYSELEQFIIPLEEDLFELTEAELAELDYRMKNDTVTYTHEEVMSSLRARYATDTSKK